MSTRSPLLGLGPLRLVAGLVPLMLSAGCGFLSGDGRVTIATATVTVTPEAGSSGPASPSASPVEAPPPAVSNEPVSLQGLELADPAEFTRGPGSWSFASASGDVVCRFAAGDSGFCHVGDDSGPPWNPNQVCDLHHDQDPEGARSTLVGWEADYRQRPCHTFLEGDWPRTAPSLPSGKKIVLQADPDHGVTVTCGQQGPSLTCANNDNHGFTASKGSVKLW